MQTSLFALSVGLNYPKQGATSCRTKFFNYLVFTLSSMVKTFNLPTIIYWSSSHLSTMNASCCIYKIYSVQHLVFATESHSQLTCSYRVIGLFQHRLVCLDSNHLIPDVLSSSNVHHNFSPSYRPSSHILCFLLHPSVSLLKEEIFRFTR